MRVQGSLEQACHLQSMAVPSLEMPVLVNKQEDLITSAFLLVPHPLIQIKTDLLHLVCFKNWSIREKERNKTVDLPMLRRLYQCVAIEQFSLSLECRKKFVFSLVLHYHAKRLV